MSPCRETEEEWRAPLVPLQGVIPPSMGAHKDPNVLTIPYVLYHVYSSPSHLWKLYDKTYPVFKQPQKPRLACCPKCWSPYFTLFLHYILGQGHQEIHWWMNIFWEFHSCASQILYIMPVLYSLSYLWPNRHTIAERRFCIFNVLIKYPFMQTSGKENM